MSPLFTWNGKLLISNNALAIAPECCCNYSGCCPQLDIRTYLGIGENGHPIWQFEDKLTWTININIDCNMTQAVLNNLPTTAVDIVEPQNGKFQMMNPNGDLVGLSVDNACGNLGPGSASITKNDGTRALSGGYPNQPCINWGWSAGFINGKNDLLYVTADVACNDDITTVNVSACCGGSFMLNTPVNWANPTATMVPLAFSASINIHNVANNLGPHNVTFTTADVIDGDAQWLFDDGPYGGFDITFQIP